MLAGLGMTPLYAAVLVGAAQNIFSKSSKYSLFDPCKEMAYIPLEDEIKTKGKVRSAARRLLLLLLLLQRPPAPACPRLPAPAWPARDVSLPTRPDPPSPRTPARRPPSMSSATPWASPAAR
jgi:hypothetical protein